MSNNTADSEARYELPLPGERALGRPSVQKHEEESLPQGLLIENVRWFCRLRWIVIVTLLALYLRVGAVTSPSTVLLLPILILVEDDRSISAWALPRTFM